MSKSLVSLSLTILSHAVNNSQIMEIILDMNSSLNTPANLRYDISSPSLAAVPELETDRAKTSTKGARLKADNLLTLRETPHTTLNMVNLNKLPPELEDLDNTLPPGYFTSQHEEEYIAALQASLASVNTTNDVSIPGTHLFSQPKERPVPTERDFAIHHPSSVYNWLRVHQPQVFDTKDKESEKGDTAPSKGKGKKEKTTKNEHEGPEDEEVDTMLAAGLGSVKGGKKKRDDETAYRPKGGHSRSSKRKRDKDDTDGSKSGKKPRKSETILGEEEP